MSSNVSELLSLYERGSAELNRAVAGMTDEQLRSKPVPGKWSTHEVVCHISDAELLYADRIKRVIAEEYPLLLGMDPDVHVPRIAIRERNVAEELKLVELTRSQMTRILRTLPPETFQRTGKHSEEGPMTLETLLSRIANHIPHHIKFIAEKRAALQRT